MSHANARQCSSAALALMGALTLVSGCLADERDAAPRSSGSSPATSQPTTAPSHSEAGRSTSQPSVMVPTTQAAAATSDRDARASAAMPSAPLSSGRPDVDAILDRLESKGAAIKSLSAQIIYRHVTTVPVTDAQKKVGELQFARGEPSARFLVHFTKLIVDGVVSTNEEYYAFDGEWYVERVDAGKNVSRRQMAPRGEKVDLFELGKGPFPLPFGQKRSEILKHFEVALALPQKDDPPGSKHLHCVPRPQSSMADEYTRVEIYVETARDIPIRIVTERGNDMSRVEVDFNDVRLNDAPAGSRFTVETPAGFSETIEPAVSRPAIDLTPVGEIPGDGQP